MAIGRNSPHALLAEEKFQRNSINVPSRNTRDNANAPDNIL